MKKIIATLTLCVLLTSCGASVTQSTEVSKTPFEIATKKIANTENAAFSVEKGITLTPGSSLTVASQTSGDVGRILVKEGASVKKGQAIIELKDSVSMLDLSVAQAANSVNSANAARSVTTIGLDRAINDAQTAYEQATRTYDTLSRDIVERRKQADNDYYNANPSNSGSTASLNLEKTKLDIATAEDNLKNQITGMQNSLPTYVNGFLAAADQALYEGDKILGMTSAYQYTVGGWDAYVDARNNGTEKNKAKDAWNALYALRGEIRAMSSGAIITPDNAGDYLDRLSRAHAGLRSFVSAMSNSLQNSVVGAGLGADMLAGWNALFNGIKSSSQGAESAFIGWKNSITPLVRKNGAKSSAENNIESMKLQISLAEKGVQNGNSSAEIAYKRTLIALDDQLKAAKLSLTQAQNAVETAKKNKAATLSQLGASVQGASIALAQASRNRAKLTLVAPVDGKITKIRVSLGQTLSLGNPAFDIASTTPEILTDVDYRVAFGVNIGDEVGVNVDNNTFTGTITALSRVAGANLLYSIRLSIPEASAFIGRSAKIIFHVKNSANTESIFLPLASVKIVSEQEGEINILKNDNTTEKKSVKLGKLAGDTIEILTPLDPDTTVILSDITNYDPTKHDLRVQ